MVHLKMHFKSAASLSRRRDASRTPDALFPRFDLLFSPKLYTRPIDEQSSTLVDPTLSWNSCTVLTNSPANVSDVQIYMRPRIYASSNTG